MQLLIQAVAALGILISGVALIFASIELKRLRLRLQTGVLRVLLEPERIGCCHVVGPPMATREAMRSTSFVMAPGRWKKTSAPAAMNLRLRDWPEAMKKRPSRRSRSRNAPAEADRSFPDTNPKRQRGRDNALPRWRFGSVLFVATELVRA